MLSTALAAGKKRSYEGTENANTNRSEIGPNNNHPRLRIRPSQSINLSSTIADAMDALKPRIAPICLLHMEYNTAGGKHEEAVVAIKMFTDKAPKACANFMALCNGASHPDYPSPFGYSSHGKTGGEPGRFHAMHQNFVHGGNLVGSKTTHPQRGNFTIYGKSFNEPESVGWKTIDSPGLVCMTPSAGDYQSYDSTFLISLGPYKAWSRRGICVGHVFSGLEFLTRACATMELDGRGHPINGSELLIRNSSAFDPKSDKHSAVSFTARKGLFEPRQPLDNQKPINNPNAAPPA